MNALTMVLMGLWFVPPAAITVEHTQAPLVELAQDYGSGVPTLWGGRNLVSPLDWSGAVVAWYDCEGAPTTFNQSGGTCGADCNLTESGTVGADTTTFVEGTQSCQFDASTDLLTCVDATCDELDFANQDFTFMLWARFDNFTTALSTVRNMAGATLGGYQSFAQATTGAMRCRYQDAATTDGPLSTTGRSTTTWYHISCAFDQSTDYTLFVDEVSDTVDTTLGTLAAGDADFTLSAVPSPLIGRLDEVAVASTLWTALQRCRKCSCGVSQLTNRCMCTAQDPSQYAACTTDADCRPSGNTTARCSATTQTCTGLNSTTNPGCGSCTLPACDAAAP